MFQNGDGMDRLHDVSEGLATTRSWLGHLILYRKDAYAVFKFVHDAQQVSEEMAEVGMSFYLCTRLHATQCQSQFWLRKIDD